MQALGKPETQNKILLQRKVGMEGGRKKGKGGRKGRKMGDGERIKNEVEGISVGSGHAKTKFSAQGRFTYLEGTKGQE